MVVFLGKRKAYKISCLFRDNTIIAITIFKVIGKTVHKVTIRDSYTILYSSLKKLCEQYDTNYTKSDFLHNFSKKVNLFLFLTFLISYFFFSKRGI